MKRTIVIILSIISSVVLIVLLALFVRNYIVPILNIGDSQINNPETFLMASQSPDGKYNLEAYRTQAIGTLLFMMPITNTKPKSFGLTIQQFQLTE